VKIRKSCYYGVVLAAGRALDEERLLMRIEHHENINAILQNQV
jgi:hypothetical protein